MVFECHDITVIYHGIFYINPTNTCLETKYFKSWYLVDMQKASHCYKNFDFEWSFKYSRKTNVTSKVWYLKHSFLPWYSSIPWFCLKILKIFCFQPPPPEVVFDKTPIESFCMYYTEELTGYAYERNDQDK
jgi:hypothetical protein